MIKKLTLTFILIIIGLNVWFQIIINGTVISKEDKEVLPGVNVLEKGTKNGTVISIDGSFSLLVSDTNAVLVFSWVGIITQEYQLKGRDPILVKMKYDCHIDYFDTQSISIYANSGNKTQFT